MESRAGRTERRERDGKDEGKVRDEERRIQQREAGIESRGRASMMCGDRRMMR